MLLQRAVDVGSLWDVLQAYAVYAVVQFKAM